MNKNLLEDKLKLGKIKGFFKKSKKNSKKPSYLSAIANVIITTMVFYAGMWGLYELSNVDSTKKSLKNIQNKLASPGLEMGERGELAEKYLISKKSSISPCKVYGHEDTSRDVFAYCKFKEMGITLQFSLNKKRNGYHTFGYLYNSKGDTDVSNSKGDTDVSNSKDDTYYGLGLKTTEIREYNEWVYSKKAKPKESKYVPPKKTTSKPSYKGKSD
jgi:hypothetical protein